MIGIDPRVAAGSRIQLRAWWTQFDGQHRRFVKRGQERTRHERSISAAPVNAGTRLVRS
jgi:hypothetical protein